MRSLAILIASVALTAHARADLVCHATNTPLAPTTWNTTVVVPRFDPALGTLNHVDIGVTGSMLTDYFVEILDLSPFTITANAQVLVMLKRPDASLILTATPSQVIVDVLAPFDGTIDFMGPSGNSHFGVTAATTARVSLSSAADLALFSGAAGGPGSLTLQVAGVGAGTTFGGTGVISQFHSAAASIISVCYDYTPVAASFCAGDGQSTLPCPCGNDSPVGDQAGCLNSLGVGAMLRGTGTASLWGDTLVLTGTNLPATATGLFFQGTTQVASGTGTVFGDGLRCVDGAVRRIARKTASAGVMTYPQAGDAPISTVGAAAPNSTLHYQLWYRNNANFCTNATFNLSQAVSVLWTL